MGKTIKHRDRGSRARTFRDVRQREANNADKRASSGSRINRRRLERGADGGCYKRQFATPEEAQRAAVRSLMHPTNPVTAVAVYLCRRCGFYHKTRQTTGSNIVAVIEREPT